MYSNLWLIVILMISKTKDVSLAVHEIKSDFGVSFNQLKFCPSATWNPDAITFANRSTIKRPISIFVDINNTIHVVDLGLHLVRAWLEEDMHRPRNISHGLNSSLSIFVTINGDIYVDNGNFIGRVDKWTSNATTSVTAMYVNSSCYGLFVDIYDNVYCSLGDLHQVIKRSFNDDPNITTIVAGNGIYGSALNMLHNPRGIFLDTNLNLYVADCGNDRIQIFPFGELNGTTVAGGHEASRTIALGCPMGIVLDADGFLFISERDNHRIVGSGPNGFRCIAGCTGMNGSAPNQLDNPRSFSFDSYGNMFVVDAQNRRIQKFLLATNSCGRSYNQPKFSPCATWNPNATTFANRSIVSTWPWGLFIDINNTVYVADKDKDKVLVRLDGNMTSWRTISGNLYMPFTVFVTINGDIYVDNGRYNNRVDMWTSNSTSSVMLMNVSESCYGLFVDLYNNLYCSINDHHKVIKRSFNASSNTTRTIAGNGTQGSASTRLFNPRGIFVDNNSNLYVADCGNNRIQLFQFNQLNGTTLSINGITGTITLNCPTGIVFDGDGYLYITDYSNHRIVGSGPNGFRCIAGCTGVRGSGSNQLYHPRSLSFDSYGNIYVADGYNNRIQKFLLATNSCEETTTNSIQSTAISTLTLETSFTKVTQQMVQQPLHPFIPLTCSNTSSIGVNCNISNTPCDIFKPCQNNGTCYNNDTIDRGYVCLCASGFTGTQCQFDHRPCKPNTCWNNGICNETSNTTFTCLCSSGLEGIHCEIQINYCTNVKCLNNGVCRPLFLNYTCECLGNSHSGRHCEIISSQTVVYKTVSKSFAFIAIIAMISFAMFIIMMDILKYGFGINPIHNELKQIQKKKKPKPVIIRFRYVNEPLSQKTTSTIEETKV